MSLGTRVYTLTLYYSHYNLGMHVEMWQNNKSNWMKGDMSLHCALLMNNPKIIIEIRCEL